MRTSVIIRIACWSVIALLLAGVLIWGIGGGIHRTFCWPFRALNNAVAEFDELRGEKGAYSTDNIYTVDAASIQNIDISWISGKVNITPYEGSDISFSESAMGGISQKNALRYAISGNTLYIQYWERNLNWGGRWPSKNLEVLLPSELADGLSELSVESVSASVSIHGLGGEDIEVETISGKVEVMESAPNELSLEATSGSLNVRACEVPLLQAETISGAIKLDGAFNEVHTETISGSARITSSLCPARVSMETISGANTLAISDNPGFTAHYDSVSGSFSCAFPATVSDHVATYGDGSASFTLSSVSGALRIEQMN